MDAGLQQTIFDWFQYREVVDDDKFAVFFTRVLNEHIRRYDQILRLEPGIAEYDWMVQRYLESQTTASDQDSKQTTDNRQTSYGGTLQVAQSGSDTETLVHGHTIAKTGTETDAEQYGHTIAKTGSEENHIAYDTEVSIAKTGTEALGHGHTVTTDDDATQTIAGERRRTTTDTRVIHNDTANSRTGDFYTETDGYTVNDQKGLTKQNPMSNSYANGIAEPTIDHTATDGGSGATGGSLDWHSPSAQTAQFGRDVAHNKTTEHRGVDNTAGTQYVDAGGSLVEAESYPNYADTQARDVSEVHSGTDTTTYNTQNVETKIGADVTTVTHNTTDTHGGTDTSTTTHNTTDTHGGTDRTTRTLGTATTTTDGRTTTNSGGTTITGSGTSDRKTRHTGRYTDPATLLNRAVRFIMSTDAWDYLYPKLDVCFMAVYDID